MKTRRELLQHSLISASAVMPGRALTDVVFPEASISEQIDSFRLSDGRCLQYRVLGNTSCQPILYFHGFPGTYYELDMCRRKLDLDSRCFVGVNRPGHGLSTAANCWDFVSFANDIKQLLSHFKRQHGWTEYTAVAMSGGCPYALACAQSIHQISRLAVVCSPSQNGASNSGGILSKLATAAVRNPRIARRQLQAMIRVVSRRGITDLSTFIGGMPRVDRIALRAVGPQLAKAMSYSALCGIRGIFRDLQLLACPWAQINLGEIKTPVHIWHGQCDRNSPYQNSIDLHQSLPNSECALFPEEAHISTWVNQIDMILARLDRA